MGWQFFKNIYSQCRESQIIVDILSNESVEVSEFRNVANDDSAVDVVKLKRRVQNIANIRVNIFKWDPREDSKKSTF